MAVWKVVAQDSGLSLQAFLRKYIASDISAKQIKRALDLGKCQLNGHTERFGTHVVGLGDRIEMAEFSEIQAKGKRITADPSQAILYSDDDLIAYDKPPGISSEASSLITTLEQQFGRVILLHRLDKGTSGVLLFARNEVMAREVEALFKKRLVIKTYYAIVDGIPTVCKGRVDNFLGKLHAYAGQTLWGSVSQEHGLPASTAWEVKCMGQGVALIVCHPETGRTHQIRVHLSEIGYPILGDHQYCRRFKCSFQPQRLMLHAAEVELPLSRDKKILRITSPLPADFEETLTRLRFSRPLCKRSNE